MSGLAGDIGIDKACHTDGAAYGISSRERGLANHDSGVLTASRGVARNCNSVAKFYGTVW